MLSFDELSHIDLTNGIKQLALESLYKLASFNVTNFLLLFFFYTIFVTFSFYYPLLHFLHIIEQIRLQAKLDHFAYNFDN